MPFHLTARRGRAAWLLCAALAAAAVSACSSSSSSSAPPAAAAAGPASAPATPAGPAGAGSAAAVKEITANWVAFFNAKTPNSKRAQLLQNGDQFATSITAYATSPLAGEVSSKVDSVTLTSSSRATVKYDLSAMGTTAAAAATGTAVLQDGTWKVGDNVFCGLLTEANGAGVTMPVPALCKSAG